ncbi:MAG: hypothetical protein COY81_00125 [Candidatus Pacebacteria bacterium CG_4_10_14_0_8_um_filter_43_12]|nr:MAG: hypothetical protein COY81_00125 [Candidatus Pacebacteria bacterium CG_4_10_14_0_8_um_filter_43_12]
MKICFYSPYLPTHFGGGEKHLFDVALIAAQSHQVKIAISDRLVAASGLQSIKRSYQQFLGCSLDSLSFISTPLGSKKSFLHKLWWTKQFDGLYYVSDGSLFFSLAQHNYLHLQVPFSNSMSALIDRLKLLNWDSKNTNSVFTKQVIERYWPTTIDAVINPMVDLDEFKSDRPQKKPYILSVGRFFRQLHSKRQDVLVEAFKSLRSKYPKETKEWQLILVGSVEDTDYFEEIVATSHNLPIVIKTDVNRAELVKLYQQSSIYWHATGYHIDQAKEPTKVEHFGISTLEAMAAGMVPVVQAKGGQLEILTGALAELGWLELEECVGITQRLITDQPYRANMVKLASDRAENFSKPRFIQQVNDLFNQD